MDKTSRRLYKLFIYAVLLALAVSIVVPVGWVFLASIKENSEFYGNPWAMPKGVYIQNFIDAFAEARMGDYFMNSVIVTALALLLLLVLALPAAYVLARYRFPGSKLCNVMFMGGLFINVNYIVVPIFLMFVDGDRWMNQVIGRGFFLNNLFIVALVYAATALPFTIYLLSGFFITIPKDYEEAAFVDGCGYWRTMIQVMMPMARPSIITVILFNFLSFWNEYIISMTLLTGEEQTLPVGLMRLMQAQQAAANYGRLYAGLVIVMLPVLILYICVQKKLTEGMSLGGAVDGQVEIGCLARERSARRVALRELAQGVDGGVETLLAGHLLAQRGLLAGRELLHGLAGQGHVVLQLLALRLGAALHRIERYAPLLQRGLLLGDGRAERIDAPHLIGAQGGHGADVRYASRGVGEVAGREQIGCVTVLPIVAVGLAHHLGIAFALGHEVVAGRCE